jgi:Protein of unknown function (DUF3606)
MFSRLTFGAVPPMADNDHLSRRAHHHLGCTKEQLVSAVGSVGPIAKKVEAYLKRK